VSGSCTRPPQTCRCPGAARFTEPRVIVQGRPRCFDLFESHAVLDHGLETIAKETAEALAALPVTTGQLTVNAETSSGGTSTPVSSTAQTLVPTLVGGGQVNYGSFTPSLVVTKNMPIQ